MASRLRSGTGVALLIAFSQPALAATDLKPPSGSTAPVGVAGAPTPAAQQTSSNTRDAEIIVNGRRLSREEYREQAKSFVRDLGVAAGLKPAARWLEPACPSVVGLAEDQSAQVEAQLRKVAQEVRVPLAPAPCTTNIVVSFTDDAKSLVRSLQKRAIRLPGMSAREREAIVEGDAPVRWWYTTDTVSRYGAKAGVMNPTITLDGGAGGTSLPGADKSNLGHYTSSIVSTQVMRSLESATVIVDVSKAEGVSLDALAAYAALVAFAEINARDAAPPASILGNLRPGGPAELMDMDVAFLRALYQLSLDREALAHRGSLVAKMVNRKD